MKGDPRSWASAAALLVAGFVLLPPLLPGGPGAQWFTGESAITGAAATAFRAWPAGQAQLPPTLSGLVDYWSTFHLAKALVAALLLGVGVAGWVVSRRMARAGFAMVVAFALVGLLANLQGVAAPLASLASMVPSDVRRTWAGASPTSLRHVTLLGDFAAYHWALAGAGLLVTLGLALGATLAWRHRARGTAGFAALGAVVVAVLIAANVSTAMDPAPAFASFLAS